MSDVVRLGSEEESKDLEVGEDVTDTTYGGALPRSRCAPGQGRRDAFGDEHGVDGLGDVDGVAKVVVRVAGVVGALEAGAERLEARDGVRDAERGELSDKAGRALEEAHEERSGAGADGGRGKRIGVECPGRQGLAQGGFLVVVIDHGRLVRVVVVAFADLREEGAVAVARRAGLHRRARVERGDRRPLAQRRIKGVVGSRGPRRDRVGH